MDQSYIQCFKVLKFFSTIIAVPIYYLMNPRSPLFLYFSLINILELLFLNYSLTKNIFNVSLSLSLMCITYAMYYEYITLFNDKISFIFWNLNYFIWNLKLMFESSGHAIGTAAMIQSQFITFFYLWSTDADYITIFREFCFHRAIGIFTLIIYNELIKYLYQIKFPIWIKKD